MLDACRSFLDPKDSASWLKVLRQELTALETTYPTLSYQEEPEDLPNADQEESALPAASGTNLDHQDVSESSSAITVKPSSDLSFVSADNTG